MTVVCGVVLDQVGSFGQIDHLPRFGREALDPLGGCGSGTIDQRLIADGGADADLDLGIEPVQREMTTDSPFWEIPESVMVMFAALPVMVNEPLREVIS